MCYTQEFGFDLANGFDLGRGGAIITCLLQATDVFLLKVQSAAVQLCLVSACNAKQNFLLCLSCAKI